MHHATEAEAVRPKDSHKLKCALYCNECMAQDGGMQHCRLSTLLPVLFLLARYTGEVA